MENECDLSLTSLVGYKVGKKMTSVVESKRTVVLRERDADFSKVPIGTKIPFRFPNGRMIDSKIVSKTVVGNDTIIKFKFKENIPYELFKDNRVITVETWS